MFSVWLPRECGKINRNNAKLSLFFFPLVKVSWFLNRETLKIQVLDLFIYFFFGITIMSIIKRSLGSFFFFIN